MKTKARPNMKMETKTKMKTAPKTKTKMKTKMKSKMNFRFCFNFVFHFRFSFSFYFLKVFAFLLIPRGLEVPGKGQLSLTWSIIQICRIQWCCSLFCFQQEIPFLGQFYPKNKNCQFKVKFGSLCQWIYRIQWCRSSFSFLTRNILFAQIWSKKSKLSV